MYQYIAHKLEFLSLEVLNLRQIVPNVILPVSRASIFVTWFRTRITGNGISASANSCVDSVVTARGTVLITLLTSRSAIQIFRHVPYRTAPHRTAPYRTAPHRTAPYRTAPYRTAPHRTAPYCTVTQHCSSYRSYVRVRTAALASHNVRPNSKYAL